jgi:ATP-dependent DNA ligase
MELLVPMLANPAPKKFQPILDSDDWAAEQKLDGVRLLVHVDNGNVIPVNRKGEVTTIPKSIKDLFAQIDSGQWAFDGEFVDHEFWVFDLPFVQTNVATVVSPDSPFNLRRAILEAFFDQWGGGQGIELVPSFTDLQDKKDLLTRITAHGGEGIMLKHVRAPYVSGKRTDKMLKLKLWKSVEVIITDKRREGKDNAAMTLICPDRGPLEVGTVSTIGKGPIDIGDVVEVKYLYAVDPARPKLYQPSIMRVRTDKGMEECTVDQLLYTNKSVVADPLASWTEKINIVDEEFVA